MKLEVKLNQAGMGSIKLDNQTIPKTTGIRLYQEVGDVTRVDVSILPEAVDLESLNAEVYLTVGDRRFLVKEVVKHKGARSDD